LSETLEEAERAHILATLKKTRWVLAGPNGAAIRLGLNRSTLQFRMKKLGIVRPGL
jgi:formate hydrogenlyase transcriptional activator